MRWKMDTSNVKNRHLAHTLLQHLKDIAIEDIENIYERCLATTLVTN